MQAFSAFVRGVSVRTERHCRLFVVGAMPNRIWRIRNLRRRLRILRRRLRILRRIRILRRARQARHELRFNFSQANALVADLIVERIRFRDTAALRASTQMRLIVRAWRHQVTQSVERALRLIERAWRQQVTTHSIEYAFRCVRQASELAERAHEEKVQALLHLEQILGFRADFNPT